MTKIAPSTQSLIIARQYLKHEFRKILAGPKDPKIWSKIDRSLDRLAKTDEQSFWNLVAAIAEGWKLKAVFRILSDSTYRWKLQSIPLNKLTLTGMSPAIDRYVIQKFKRNPESLRKELQKKRSAVKKAILKAGIEPKPDVDHYPILIFESKEKELKVFDGMRRTLLALMKNQKNIRAWVGYRKNPQGKPLISRDRCLFLAEIYQFSKHQDKNLVKSITRVGKEVTLTYRNGKDVLHKRIAGWSHDPAVKKLFRKIK